MLEMRISHKILLVSKPKEGDLLEYKRADFRAIPKLK
jgi:hypothetical protein